MLHVKIKMQWVVGNTCLNTELIQPTRFWHSSQLCYLFISFCVNYIIPICCSSIFAVCKEIQCMDVSETFCFFTPGL